MGHPSISPKVAAYFIARPGESLYVNTIAQDLNLNILQVQSAIGNINRRNGDLSIDTIVRGQVWRYRPKAQVEVQETPKSKSSVFAFVGAARDGTIVLERDDGVLFRASEL